ncbi:hypothetical protein CsSME_00021238 [Camellia sinensis var. sinensis]
MEVVHWAGSPRFGYYSSTATSLDLYNRLTKGIIPALNELVPESEHRHCVRHLHNNFKKQFPGLALKDRMWRCAMATTIRRFTVEMELLTSIKYITMHAT